MPIDKQEWDEGRVKETLESRILTFLQKNKPKAYSKQEILQSFQRTPNWEPSDDLGDKIWKGIIAWGAVSSVENALENLIQEGKVEKRTIQQEITENEYYRAT